MHIPKPLLALGFLVLAASGALKAATPGKSFVMRNTEPVVVYNTLLTPGTHVWRLLDSSSNRNIVQITDQTTDRVEAVIFAIPSYRETATSTNEIQFWETPVGYARAVRTWFSPGANYGQEFPYSKKAVLNSGRLIAAVTPPMQSEITSRKILKAVAKTRPSTQWPEGSWAIVTDGVPGAPAARPALAASPLKPAKHADGFWDTIKHLPMTATIAPLIGLIGVVCMTLFFLSHLKRKNRQMPQPR